LSPGEQLKVPLSNNSAIQRFNDSTPVRSHTPTHPHTHTAPPVARIGSLHPATELFQQKKFHEARNCVLEAIQRRPFHPEAYLLLAEIAKGAGDFSEARRCADRSAQMAPGLKTARKFLKALPGSASQKGEFSWTPLPDKLSPPRLSVCIIARNEEQF